MKDQVMRILRMVQDGRLSPDDAYELMAAFVNFDSGAGQETDQVHEPTVDQPEQSASKSTDDPFKKLMDSVEKMTKEGIDSVNWKEVASSVKSAAMRGVDTLRTNVEQMTKGDFRVFWSSNKADKTVELPLHVGPDNALRVEWKHGDIKVRGGHSIGSMKSTATFRGKSTDEASAKADAWTPIVEENDGNITLKQSSDADSEDLELYLPEGVSLDVRAECGDIDIDGTKGPIRITTIKGDISVKEVAGSVEINSASADVSLAKVENGSVEIEVKQGDISLANVAGTIKIRSASGDVKGKEISGRSLSVETVDGEVDIDFSEALDGALSIRTVSGDVLIDLAGGSNCRVALSSLSGSARCDFELEDEKRTKERITGRIGNGDGTLDVSTVKGQVSLSLRDHYR
ncbi:MAG: DUF4097 family beta strand repeat protein [Fimbriimonadales bacterium]|nr:DUF4097 family beta strand repeat protein [Fimbriimonadales bacterium]